MTEGKHEQVRLERLIQQYCPDGVEYVRLGDVMSIQRGASPRPIQNYLTDDEYGIPWIKIGDVSIESKYITSTKERVTKEGAAKSRFLKRGSFILSNSMSFGRPYILEIDGCIHDGWISMCDFEKHLLPDFLYYLLRSSVVQDFWISKANSGGAVTNLNSDIVRSTLIPVPPLPVQEEIVRILDTFTELQAELQKRLQQYEYYKWNIFEGLSCPTKHITDVALVKARVGWQRLTTAEYQETGDYYLITGTDFKNGKIDFNSCVFVSKERYEMDPNIIVGKGDILITKDGTLGKVAFMAEEPNKPTTLNSGVFRIHTTDPQVSSRYLFHYFTSKYFTDFVNSVKTGSTIPHLTQQGLVSLNIPIPSLEEQNRVVSILDRFDTLTNDLTSGLPAEMEKRRQQYEYYRDRLLTFKRL